MEVRLKEVQLLKLLLLLSLCTTTQYTIHYSGLYLPFTTLLAKDLSWTLERGSKGRSMPWSRRNPGATLMLGPTVRPCPGKRSVSSLVLGLAAARPAGERSVSSLVLDPSTARPPPLPQMRW